MAYRRKQGFFASGGAATFAADSPSPPYPAPPSAAPAAADRRSSHPQDSASYGYTSIKSLNEPKLGLWENLARKAKGILDEDAATHKFDDYRKDQPQKFDSSTGTQVPQSRWSYENYQKTENPASRTRSEALAASVNQLGGRIRNALEEGLTIVDNKTSNIIQETKKIQIRRKSSSSNVQNQAPDTFSPVNLSQNQAEAAQERQLKASRDVANAMAAKAKLLLRELKTVKADLAFAKERCTQLEQENKLLRETKQKGSRSEEDDDLIRLQLETLLAEKSRLAQENSMYARENRFLREIVEFHQFATHDVVPLDGDMEDSSIEDANDIYANDMPSFSESHAAHEELSPVLSSPASPVACPGEPSSPQPSSALGSSASDLQQDVLESQPAQSEQHPSVSHTV